MKPRLSLNEYQQKHTEIEGLIGNGNFCAKSSANGNATLVQRVKASIAAPDTMLNRVVSLGAPHGNGTLQLSLISLSQYVSQISHPPNNTFRRVAISSQSIKLPNEKCICVYIYSAPVGANILSDNGGGLRYSRSACHCSSPCAG
jgi:hypothetical protein